MNRFVDYSKRIEGIFILGPDLIEFCLLHISLAVEYVAICCWRIDHHTVGAISKRSTLPGVNLGPQMFSAGIRTIDLMTLPKPDVPFASSCIVEVG